MMVCKGICNRFEIKLSNNLATYSDGYIRCKNCDGIVTHVDVVKEFIKENPDLGILGDHRCPCCHGIFSTHSKHRNESETYKRRNLTESQKEKEIKTSIGIKINVE